MTQAESFVHWRRLIAINAAILPGYIIYRMSRDFLSLAYIELLVDYHFGFTKRALVGAALSLLWTKVPEWAPFAVGIALLSATLALYLKLFQKTFGFAKDNAALFVFIAGSPFFFKNFISSFGYFDMFGCAFAIVMLLIPARSFAYIILAAAGSILLVIIHPVQTLLYVPTISVIAVMRYFAAKPTDKSQIVAGVLLLAAVAATFIISMVYGNPNASQDEFYQYLLSRSNTDNDNWVGFIFVWYRPFTEEVLTNFRELPYVLPYVPVYIALATLHAPLIRYFRQVLDALASPRDRSLVLVGMALITFGYFGILATVSYDLARWVSDWIVCMMLVLHLVRQLPSKKAVSPIAVDNWWVISLGLVITIIPRVGLIRPF